jgi:16S rRNA (cytidine1402-2'-O)-methyltransferase
LGEGQTVALTTDAGMPAVSDPGARLVAAARAGGIAIEAVPGPAAVTTAFAVAGIEAPGFVFGGFLPARPASARAASLHRLLDAAGSLDLPLIVYEAPHRVRSLVAALVRAAPECRVVLGRELTKRHEEVIAGRPDEVARALAEHAPRGEFTVVVHDLAAPPAGATPDLDGLEDAARAAGLSERGIADLLRAAGLGRREAYRRARGMR